VHRILGIAKVDAEEVLGQLPLDVEVVRVVLQRLGSPGSGTIG